MHHKIRQLSITSGVIVAFTMWVAVCRGDPGERKSQRPPSRKDLHGDALPAGAIARLGTVRFRLGGTFAVFSPDGRFIATSSRRKQDRNVIRLLDAVTGKELRRLVGHELEVKSVVFSPDRRLLASIGRDRTIRLWDVDNGKETRRLACDKTTGLAFSPMSNLLAFAGDNGMVRLWDLSSGKEVKRPLGPIKNLTSMMFLPDGATLVAAGYRSICFWDLSTGKEVRRLQTPSYTQSIAVSADGKHLAAYGGGIKLWNLATGQSTTLQERSAMRCVAFSRDGKLLASGGNLWEVESARLIRKLPNPRYCSTIRSLSFSPDGSVLAGGEGHIWDVASGKDLHDVRGLYRTGSRVAFTPDGKHVVSGGSGTPISLWEAATGKRLRQLTDGPFESKRLLVTPDAKTVVVDHHGQPQLFDLQTGRLRNRLTIGFLSVEDQEYQDVSGVDITPDGKLAFCGFRGSNTIRFWDMDTGEQIREFTVGPKRIANQSEPYTEVGQHAISPNGRLLAVSCSNQRPHYGTTYSVAVFDRATGKRLYAAPMPKLTDLIFSPDSRLLASEFGCWEASTGKSIHLIFGGHPWSGQIAFSPNGQWLACANEGNRFRIIDMATFETVRDVNAHQDDVECFAFSPDGARLATGSLDGTVLVWDVKQLIGPQRPAAVRQLDGPWDDLLAKNAARAHYAIWTLAADPQQAIPFLAERLHPAPLDEPKVGANANGQMFAKIRRKLRAVTVLEYIGTTEARRLLERIANGAPGAAETDEAKAALERLSKRTPS